MKRAGFGLGIVGLTVLAVTASADAAPRKNSKASHERKSPAQVERELAHGPRMAHWMASEPHVPLAVVAQGAIRSVGMRGATCGAPSRWATRGTRWKAVDAFGQLVGTVEAAGGDVYDVTKCKELNFVLREGREGSGLFVAEDAHWQAPRSVEWNAPADERTKFEAFVKDVERMHVDGKLQGRTVPVARRTLFFHTPAHQEGDRQHGVRVEPRVYAVAGGPVLVVGYLGADHQWKVEHIKRPLGLANSYSPLAVFDMSGDGFPEIVYHDSDGPSFGDAVLSRGWTGARWTDAAVSPGGGTP